MLMKFHVIHLPDIFLGLHEYYFQILARKLKIGIQIDDKMKFVYKP